MATQMDAVTLTTIRDFLRLPKESLPAAEYISGGIPGLASAWDALRAVRAGDPDGLGDMISGDIRLRADCDGWRDGVVVSI